MRITATVQLDYSQRGVFRHLTALEISEQCSAWTEYLVPHADALVMLEDAKTQAQLGGKGRGAAYSALVRCLEQGTKSAEVRVQILAAREATRTRDWVYSEEWRGTKAQLQASGIGVGVAFPGEPGGNLRWVQTKDSRGYTVRIRGAGNYWGLFTAEIDIPRDVVEAREVIEKERRREEGELERLKHLPATPQAFRDDAAQRFWTCVTVALGIILPKVGYRLSEEAKEQFLDGCRDAYWVIKRDGEIVGESPRKELQRRLVAGAKSNTSLQSFLQQVQATAAQGDAA